MTKQEYVNMKREMIREYDLLIEKRKELKTKYLNQLIKESGLKEEQQVWAKQWGEETKCWIVKFDLSNDENLKVILNKVKKNGENGMASYCSYGLDIEYIKPIKD